MSDELLKDLALILGSGTVSVFASSVVNKKKVNSEIEEGAERKTDAIILRLTKEIQRLDDMLLKSETEKDEFKKSSEAFEKELLQTKAECRKLTNEIIRLKL